MRDYGKVHSKFWSSRSISTLSDDGRMLALYLLTSPHGTISGVFRLPDGYAFEDLNWPPERVAKGFAELFDKGFANRCETTKWVWVIKHFVWNPPENPNQRKSAKKIALTIPDECVWKPEFMRVWGEHLEMPPSLPGPDSGTLKEPLPNPSLTSSSSSSSSNKLSTEQFALQGGEDFPEPASVVDLPLVDGTQHAVMQTEVDEWALAYPAVDVVCELRKMRVWLAANPRKRKTARGINGFAITWLTRSQDKGPVNGSSHPSGGGADPWAGAK